jgi:hypothetical protein
MNLSFGGGRAEREEGANARFIERDPCDGAMVLWWVFGDGLRVLDAFDLLDSRAAYDRDHG